MMGAFSTLVGPLVSLSDVAKAQSCGWTEAILGWTLERVVGPTITSGGYYGYCGYFAYLVNYYYNGVLQYTAARSDAIWCWPS